MLICGIDFFQQSRLYDRNYFAYLIQVATSTKVVPDMSQAQATQVTNGHNRGTEDYAKTVFGGKQFY